MTTDLRCYGDDIQQLAALEAGGGHRLDHRRLHARLVLRDARTAGA